MTLPSFSQPPHPRKGHAGPNLGDTWYDRSLYTFFGFTDTGITNQVWAFELQDLSWRRITAANNLVRQFANGTSLQLGGSAQTDAQVLPEPRVYSSGVQLDGGTLVLFGGLSEVSDTGRHAFSDVWTFRKSAPFKGLEFNVLTKMSTLPVEPEGRFQHAATRCVVMLLTATWRPPPLAPSLDLTARAAYTQRRHRDAHFRRSRHVWRASE